jgi:hypothetical protein
LVVEFFLNYWLFLGHWLLLFRLFLRNVDVLRLRGSISSLVQHFLVFGKEIVHFLELNLKGFLLIKTFFLDID